MWRRYAGSVGQKVGVLYAEVVFAEEAGLEGAVQALIHAVGVAYTCEILDSVLEHG